MVIFSFLPFDVHEAKKENRPSKLLTSLCKMDFVEVCVPKLQYEKMKFFYCQPDLNMRQVRFLSCSIGSVII